MAYTDPYRVLGINRNASEAQIKEAYRDLAKKFHPDNFSDPNAKQLAEEKMSEINRAYDDITSGNVSSGSSYTKTQNPYTNSQQNPWQDFTQRNNNRPYYQQQSPFGTRGGSSCCDDLLCLCCADNCCECMGGDLVPCC